MSKSNLFFPLLLATSVAACMGGEGMDDFGGERADELEETTDDDGSEEEGEDLEEVASDGYDDARNVDLPLVVFDDETLSPDFYSVPEQDTSMSLGGTEFWQRWPGGEMPTFSYSVGSETGQRCMYASAVRFSTIMADPPQEILDVLETTNWSGRFFNWNDDFSEGTSSARGARLWAWRTGLIKWISQTDTDGACHLPTRDMLIAAAQDCLETAERDEGEIQGCSAR